MKRSFGPRKLKKSAPLILLVAVLCASLAAPVGAVAGGVPLQAAEVDASLPAEDDAHAGETPGEPFQPDDPDPNPGQGEGEGQADPEPDPGDAPEPGLGPDQQPDPAPEDPASEAPDTQDEAPQQGQNPENTPEASRQGAASTPERADDPDDSEDPEDLENPEDPDALLDELPARDPVEVSTLFPEAGITKILTGFNLAFTDAGQNPEENPTINSNVNVRFDFYLPDELTDLMEQGDWYDICLTDNLQFNVGMSFPLEDEGDVFANVEVIAADTIRITFTSTVRDHNDIEGIISFWGYINEANVQVGTNTIRVPSEETLNPIDIVLRPAGGSAIDKGGTADKIYNAESVTWRIDLNKSLETLENAFLTEAFPEGLVYESVEVYAANVDVHGNILEDSLTLLSPGAGYTVDASGNLSFGTLATALRVMYTTSVDPAFVPEAGGKVAFINNAFLVSDNLGSVKATATVDTTYAEPLVKEVVGYDYATQTITWAVLYNNTGREVQNGWLEDSFSTTRMSLVDGSLKVYTVEYDDAGNPTTTGLIDEGLYTLTDSPGKGFRLDFGFTVETPLYIQYATHLEGINDGMNAGNTVTDQGGRSAYRQAWLGQYGISKGYLDFNPSEKTIGWRVRVNVAGYEMHDWSATDTYGPGLTYYAERPLTITDEATGQTLEEGAHYEINHTDTGFTLSFINGYNPITTTLNILYYTKYDPGLVTDGYLRNSITARWRGNDGEWHQNSYNASRELADLDVYNGAKGVSYSYATREFTWTIHAGYSANGLKTARIEDAILQNQEYVAGSLVIGRFTIAANGDINLGAVLSDTERAAFTIEEPDKDNDFTLTIHMPDSAAAAGMYWFEYKTSIDGRFVQKEYSNTAMLYNDGYEPRPLTASAEVKYGDSLAVKEGHLGEDGYAWWELTVNPAQSRLFDTKITDVPGENQLVDFDSLEVYEAIVADNGTVAPNYDLPLSPDAYTAAYTPDENGRWTLEVLFPGEINQPYVVSYRVTVITEREAGIEPLENTVTISSYSEKEVEQVISESFGVDVSGGSGVIRGKRSGFTLQKRCAESGDPLENAAFLLFNAKGEQIGAELTTNDNGEITLGSLVYGTYTLYEVEAPEGYSVARLLCEEEGYEVTVDASSQGRENMIVLYNDPSAVTLEKHNELGAPLEGAAFRLETQTIEGDESSWMRIHADQRYVTDETGLLTITGLVPGTYRLIETAAPTGYLLDETPYPFTVEADALGFIEPVYLGPVVNQPTAAQVVKEDSTNGDPLENCVFMLEKWVPAGEEDAEDVAHIHHADRRKVIEIQPAVITAEGEWVRILEETPLSTGEDGLLTVFGLAPGEYRFTEIQSPEGYTIDATPLPFTIEENATQVVSVGVHYNSPIPVVQPDPDPDPNPGPSPGPAPTPDPTPTPGVRAGEGSTSSTAPAAAGAGTPSSSSTAKGAGGSVTGGAARRYTGTTRNGATGTGTAKNTSVAKTADVAGTRALALGATALAALLGLGLTARFRRKKRERQ